MPVPEHTGLRLEVIFKRCWLPRGYQKAAVDSERSLDVRNFDKKKGCFLDALPTVCSKADAGRLN